MKIIFTTLYTVFTILYLLLADNTRLNGGLYMINQFSYIAILCSFVLSKDRNTKIDIAYLKYSIFVATTLFIYTLACIWADKAWVIIMNFCISAFMVIVFAVMNIYIYKNRNEFK